MSAVDDALDDLLALARVPAPTFDEGERIEWLQRRLRGRAGTAGGRRRRQPDLALRRRAPSRAAAGARRHGVRARGRARAAHRRRPPARPGRGRQRRRGRVRGPGRRAAGARAQLQTGWRSPSPWARRVSATSWARAPRAPSWSRTSCWRWRVTASCTSPSTRSGSLRARIAVNGPGGHSWANRGRPSAIDEICRIARALSRPARREASTNIGRIEGGTAVNAIAAHAELVIEQRALDEAVLTRFARALRTLDGRAAAHARGRDARAAGPPAASTGDSRCSRPCAACASVSACPTSWSRRRPTPMPRSRPASPRSASAAPRAARCTRPASTSRSRRWPRAASSSAACSPSCSGTIPRP